MDGEGLAKAATQAARELLQTDGNGRQNILRGKRLFTLVYASMQRLSFDVRNYEQ